MLELDAGEHLNNTLSDALSDALLTLSSCVVTEPEVIVTIAASNRSDIFPFV